MASGGLAASSEPSTHEARRSAIRSVVFNAVESKRAPGYQARPRKASRRSDSAFSNPRNQKTPDYSEVFLNWCPEEDSNLHEVAPAST